MRRFVPFLVLILSLGAAASPARADFVKDFRQWQMLGPQGQAAYAMGIFDVMTVIVNDDPFTVARSAGLRSCALTLKLNASMVAQAITKFYVDYPASQRSAPFIAFNGYLERGACSPFINEARKKMGLPLPKGSASP